MKKASSMRRWLLAAVLLSPAPALAQGIAVYDNLSVIQAATNFGKTMEQAMVMKGIAENHYRTGVSTYNSLVGGRPMEGVASLLRMGGIYLPGLQSGSVVDALRGAREYGNAAATVQRNLAALPRGEDLDAKEMLWQRTGLANRWESLMDTFRTTEQRNAAISELRNRAGTTRDLQESAALSNRIAAEQAALDNTNDRTLQMLMMQQTQDRINAMRERELGRQSSQDWYDATRDVWQTGWARR